MGIKYEFSDGKDVENFYIFELKNGKVFGIPSIHLIRFVLDRDGFLIKSSSENIRIMGENLRMLVPVLGSGHGFYLKEDSERFQEKSKNKGIWVEKIEVEEQEEVDVVPTY